MPTGVFPAFIRHVAESWKQQWPTVSRITAPLGPSLPKASTFSFGSANGLRKHLFVRFQHSSKAWQVGEFTVNMVLADGLRPPARSIAFADDLERGSEGVYRIGTIVHGKDKWWCLLPTSNLHGLIWRASRYGDQARVFSEAATDVTGDVTRFLEIIKHELPNKRMQLTSSAMANNRRGPRS